MKSVVDLFKSRLSVLVLALSLPVLALAAPAAAQPQLLDVAVEEESGKITVWVRDAPESVPTVSINGAEVGMVAGARAASNKFQPLGILIDRANVSPETLGKLRAHARTLVERELKAGSRKVVIQDSAGPQLEATAPNYLESPDPSAKSAVDEILDQIQVMENPDPRKPLYSSVPKVLTKLMSKMGGSSRTRTWLLVFSSLCVAPDAEGPDLTKFKGPIRIITWNEGLDNTCQRNRETWVTKVKTDNLEVYNRDLPEQREGLQKALEGLGLNDQSLSMSGIDYWGGAMKLNVVLAGAEDSSWEGVFQADSLPFEWDRQAKIKHKKQRIGHISLGFGVIIILIVVTVIIRARSSAVDFAKWEAVGEAEDLAVPLDDDAWNATIFQLTGAMPVIQALSDGPAQLGPASTEGDGSDSTSIPPGSAATTPDMSATAPSSQAIAPLDGPAISEAPAPEAAPEATTPEGSDQTTQAPVTPIADAPSTGMTVSIPVVDDGTAYEAETPFEVGVLLGGTPVARKTKKFRKVFSVGRATDNRVVIQKDDTVHRYHVVVRPAVKGKEWWLEVSPTASNRTRLNGKDLRPGGRYRLPERFRLELGESTEVRGRLAKAA